MFSQVKLGLLCLAAIIASATAARDATLEEGAKGKEVAEAVLRKLALSQIFPEDHSFLIRLAYTETRFGESNNTFRPDYHGGIWAVDEFIFNQTKSTTITSQLAEKFQINWNNTQWKDLRKPMHSGIAAALYFNYYVPVPIPQKVEDQAALWRRYYRETGNATLFIEDSEKLQNETVCRGKFDLCILLDSSNSIKPADYILGKNFIGDMIESFSRDFTRVGMVVYSDRMDVIFRLNNTNTAKRLAEMARAAPHHRGNTYTGNGILEAIKLLKEVDTEGIPKIMTIFTDGNRNGGVPYAGPLAQMKNNSIKPLSIGIGDDIDPRELLQIALNDATSVFEIQDYSALQSFLHKLTSTTCEIPQAPKLNETYDDSLIANEKRIYKIEPPAEGITITVDVTEGDTKGYWSHSIPVPTEAIYDGVIDGPTYIPAPPGIIKNETQTEAEEEELLTNIYITIQGVEPSNNYTLKMTDGDQVPPPTTTTPTPTTTELPSTPEDSGAPKTSFPSFIVAIVAILHIFF